MIDIIDLKTSNYLKFYVEDGYIYCENVYTEERVIVGKL